MPDRILLHGIQFHGHHGVREEERKLGQRFVVDVDLSLDLAAAGQRDELAASVDYEQVYALVVEVGTREQFRLLEALAERLASIILDRFPVRQVTVRATKPSPPIPGVLGSVSVEITRP
ncbi:MAG: dihydroneopterin aldolase [candidate division NC10 bacterium]|nr:dihydroneopterin aldolase [candidate division NC10 bacterium]MBI4841985.1 dihydroneopterin aldolase [candidate division NC10 bacterium]